MVAGGNGLSSASKYGLGGSAEGWAGSRIVLQTTYRQQSVFTITEEAPTMAFSWLKVPTSAFTFKTLLRHYAEQTLNRRKNHKEWAGWLS